MDTINYMRQTNVYYSKLLSFGKTCYTLYWLVLCVNLTQARVIREEGASIEELALLSIPPSRFQPCLNSCSNFPQRCKYQPNKSFPPQLSFRSWCFIGAIETLTKTQIDTNNHRVHPGSQPHFMPLPQKWFPLLNSQQLLHLLEKTSFLLMKPS